MKPQPRYQPGDKIGGRYQVHQALMGGMGEVYLCLDLKNIIPIVLKTFQERYRTPSAKLRTAFENEVATWVALEKHPNIVRCFYMDTLDNQPFMFLEWIASREGLGNDLRGWLQRGPLDLQTALDFIIDICRGLIHAQEKQPGIVHRDLKPENILITQEGVAKITDFGLAQIVQTTELEITDAERETARRQRLWGQDGIVGTPPYMAPEQWRGEVLDVRTDIYAIGCILYETLTGTWPFRATTLDNLRQQHLEASIPKLMDRTLPVALNTLLTACLAKRREERFATANDLQQQLLSIYQEQFAKSPRAVFIGNGFTAMDYVNRGKTYLDLHRYENALADCNQAIQRDSTNVIAYSNRGIAYLKLQQHDKAMADIDRAIKLDPTHPEPYINRGMVYVNLHRYDDALGCCTQAIQIDPTQVIAYANRGAIYHELEQYPKALADFNMAIEIDPTQAAPYHNRGRTYYELQWYKEALADFNMAIELDPAQPAAYIGRSNIYLDLRQYENALADLDRAIELDPTQALAYNNRGKTHLDLQKYDKALADLDQTITLDPALTTAYYNRGQVYQNMQQLDHALTDYSQAIRLDPTNTLYYFNRGYLYQNLQRYKEALADFDRAIQLDSRLAIAYGNRGIIFQGLQRYEESLSDFSRVIELKPNDAKAFYNRGNLYQGLQRHEEALADYKRVIQLDRNDVDVYLNISAILIRQDKWQETLPYLDKAAQLGHPLGAQAAIFIKLMLDKKSQASPHATQLAFLAIQTASSANEMRQIVSDFSFLTGIDMTGSGFIALAESALARKAHPKHQMFHRQRLAWLQQIADEQKRKE